MRGRSAGSASSSSRRCSEIVVPEDRALGARGADAVDHRRVVALVGEDHAAVEQAAERAQAGVVGDEARREHERGFLRSAGRRARPRARARAACEPAMLRVPPEPTPCSASAWRGRLDDRRVQAHAEVVVGAPVDDDAAAAVGEPHVGRAGRGALELDEAPVAALFAQRVEPLVEDCAAQPRWPGARRAARALEAKYPCDQNTQIQTKGNTFGQKCKRSLPNRPHLKVRSSWPFVPDAAGGEVHTGLNREADQGVSLARFSRPGARLPSDTRRRSS